MTLEFVSDSEDWLDFDNSDANPAVSYKDLESSDSEMSLKLPHKRWIQIQKT